MKELSFGRIGRGIVAALAVPALALGTAGCGEVARTGQAPVMLVVDRVEASSGAIPGEFGAFLNSDVQTLVEATIGGAPVRVPTVFSDTGRATFRAIRKNQGNLGNPLEPTALNAVTLRRYRVRFIRADGRNTPGVDVPYGFDGAVTATISGGETEIGFELVRHSMKEAPPLRNLINGGSAVFIYTIAEITFYGADQAGNEVTAVANISVNFGDWGDPQ